jgi:hypothetical protein
MASHGTARFTGPDTIEALTADREKVWENFTSAATGAVIFVIILLVAMAFFLL